MPRGIKNIHVIEGFRFCGARPAFSFARTMGFNGGLATIAARLKAGVSTISELVAPVSEDRSAVGKVNCQITKSAYARRKAEMAAMMAEVDARRSAIAAAAVADEEE